jgi:hypothetical protein
VGEGGRGLKMWSAKGWIPKEGKGLFLIEILDFLRIKYSNLHSQTKEQDLIDHFENQNF